MTSEKAGRALAQQALWSARTCPRFESDDMSPHSKQMAHSRI
jgi:hypothetical protein